MRFKEITHNFLDWWWDPPLNFDHKLNQEVTNNFSSEIFWVVSRFSSFHETKCHRIFSLTGKFDRGWLGKPTLFNFSTSELRESLKSPISCTKHRLTLVAVVNSHIPQALSMICIRAQGVHFLHSMVCKVDCNSFTELTPVLTSNGAGNQSSFHESPIRLHAERLINWPPGMTSLGCWAYPANP